MNGLLTPRQRQVYQRLLEIEERGLPPPTLDGLCRSLGLKSRGSLYKHIRALVDAGLVCPMSGLRRGVRLNRTPAGSAVRRLPLIGRIAAGKPIEPALHDDTLEVPSALAHGAGCYVLEVSGNSMRDAGIHDGDWVVIEQRTWASDGETVVALIDGEEATLKRIRQRPGKVYLLPANKAMQPLVIAPDRVCIQGVVTGLVRRYR